MMIRGFEEGIWREATEKLSLNLIFWCPEDDDPCTSSHEKICHFTQIDDGRWIILWCPRGGSENNCKATGFFESKNRAIEFLCERRDHYIATAWNEDE